MQTTDHSSSGELGDDSVIMKENDIGDIAISHHDESMGNLNELPETRILFKAAIF